MSFFYKFHQIFSQSIADKAEDKPVPQKRARGAKKRDSKNRIGRGDFPKNDDRGRGREDRSEKYSRNDAADDMRFPARQNFMHDSALDNENSDKNRKQNNSDIFPDWVNFFYLIRHFSKSRLILSSIGGCVINNFANQETVFFFS